MVKAIVALEIIYLLLLNIALNLPWTQSLINGIDADHYQASWSRAWSFYPFHLHVLDLDARGSTDSLKWRVKSPDARAVLSPAGLLRKTIKASRADIRDIYYAQQRLTQAKEERPAARRHLRLCLRQILLEKKQPLHLHRMMYREHARTAGMSSSTVPRSAAAMRL